MGANEKKLNDFVANWKATFTEQIKKQSKSKKQNFTYQDAVKRFDGVDKLDALMIEYLEFIASNPLRHNDFFKFIDAYRKGKKLNDKYFRHDLSKLHEYYGKADNDPEGYNPFCKLQYEKYVLFMMLKFSGLYLDEYNEMFNVKIDESREYSPLTSIPSVLRQSLPFRIKEFDISQAYPSFIFIELDLKPFDVYSHIGKKEFNMLLNTHKGVKGATIEAVRAKLKPVYGERVDEVITKERFENKGKLFADLSKYEAEYIKKFIAENQLTDFVRLHDGVVTLDYVNCEKLDFGNIKFKVKEFKKPETETDIVNFYDGDFKTSPVSYSRFFEQEGFLRVTREAHDYLTILKSEGRIVTPINHKTDLVPILKENINEFDTKFLEDRIAQNATNVIQQSLQLLISQGH